MVVGLVVLFAGELQHDELKELFEEDMGRKECSSPDCYVSGRWQQRRDGRRGRILRACERGRHFAESPFHCCCKAWSPEGLWTFLAYLQSAEICCTQDVKNIQRQMASVKYQRAVCVIVDDIHCCQN